MSYPSEVESRLKAWREAAGSISAALETGPSADWPSARHTYDDAFAAMFEVPGSVAFEERVLGGVDTTIARSPGQPDGGRTILYLHGGGYASGSANGYRAFAGHLARHLDARIVVPDYRLAPQHPFPAAIEDAVEVYRDLLAAGLDPRHMVIGGDSAGGAMTLTAMRRIRNAGLALPAAGFLFSPWADLAHTGASATSKAERDPLVRLPFLQHLAAAFLAGADASHPDASPIHADFDGLPPVLIQVGEREVMLSDAVRLAEWLGADRVRVTLEVWPDMFHVFPLFAGLLPEADAALRITAAFVQTAFEAAWPR